MFSSSSGCRIPPRCRAQLPCLKQLAVMLALLSFSVGCESAREESAGPRATAGSPAAEPALSAASNEQASEQDSAQVQRTEEAWEVVFIDGQRVGHARFVREWLDGDRLRNSSESELSMLRFGQTIDVQVEQSVLETVGGRLLRCSSTMRQGPVTIETTGEVKGDELVLQTKTLGKTQRESVVWEAEWGGYFVEQESLRRRPMRPGETRTLRGLLPQFNKLAEFHLSATGHESVKLLSGEASLLRIEGSVHVDGTKMMDAVYWTDEEGQPLKTEVTFSGMQTVAFRTGRETALAETGPTQFDLGARTIVKTDRSLETAHQTQRVVYEVRLAQANPAKTFVSGASQQLESLDEQTARITVVALRGDRSAASPNGDGPTDADLAANSMIQSDDSLIVSMAKQIAPTESDPWTVACALERTVRDTVKTKDFSQAMASAADVARSQEGDCTEHAVLLAALCRARDIPARVAIGLVYYREAGGFAYHMWNEVWVGNRWVALDGTLGAGGIGAAHLKITHSNLGGTSPFSALLPVLQVLGEMELRILAVE